MRFGVEELAAAVQGRVIGDPSVDVSGAGIDSRTIVPGALFVAVEAERDGHDFVAAALGAGAAAALVGHEIELADPTSVGPQIVVADPQHALTSLGRVARRRVKGPVIGVTGSVGKTTTKDLLAAVLGRAMTTAASERSFNNELGVPLTLFNAPDDVDAVVVEMGARGSGHIAELSAVAHPTIGVVTLVAAAHTEMFGTLEDIALAKGELIEALPADGWAVLNAGDAAVAAMAMRARAQVLTFGGGGGVGADGVVVGGDLRPSFVLASPWGSAEVRLAVAGRHQVVNALGAAAAAFAAGASIEQVVVGLGAARLSPWRMDVSRTARGVTVINDAYNANPTSMAAAVRSLAELPGVPSAGGSGGRRVAVLGLMAELGRDEVSGHAEIAALCDELGVELVAIETDHYGVAPVAFEAAAALLGELTDGDAVLIKASRVAGLERLVPRLA